MTNFLKSFVKDDSGASAAEYALILVVVAIGIVGAGLLLRNAINKAMTTAATCIDSPSTANCPA